MCLHQHHHQHVSNASHHDINGQDITHYMVRIFGSITIFRDCHASYMQSIFDQNVIIMCMTVYVNSMWTSTLSVLITSGPIHEALQSESTPEHVLNE